jgi:hypothetical protein
MPAQAGIQEVGGNRSRIHGSLRAKPEHDENSNPSPIVLGRNIFSPTTTTKDKVL